MREAIRPSLAPSPAGAARVGNSDVHSRRLLPDDLDHVGSAEEQVVGSSHRDRMPTRLERCDDVVRDARPFVFDLLAQDRHLGFQVGWLDVRDQAPLETGAQPLFQGGNGLGGPVAGEYDLPAG